MKATYDKTIEKSCGFLFARWSAGAKAAELALPPEKRIISDKFAPFYAGKIGMDMVKAMHVINPSIRMGIVLRARYFDDYTQQCIDDGFTQIVLLGAGYDSRFLRMELPSNVSIFELDLESTQAIKKALTRRLMGRLPQHVRYIPMNFARDAIVEKLTNAGYDRNLPTLFIWEGVTLFLNQDIIARTLGRIVELGPFHRVIFDFIPPELVDDETDYMGNRKLLKLCESIKEPLTFGCNPRDMRHLLTQLGFHNIEIIGLPDALRRYAGVNGIEDSYFFASAETRPYDGMIIPDSGNGIIHRVA